VLAGAIVPQPGEHAVPFCVNVQVTPLFVPSFVTVAVNCWVAFTATLAEVGDTDTEMGKSAIEARALAMVSATEVAINTTWPSVARAGIEGGVAGAI
jgi:hypothetical protein